MSHTIEEWLFVVMHREAPPEFRATHEMFDQAYSGPEQRRHIKRRLRKEHGRRMIVAEPLPLGTALAA